jgi:UDP-N-acetylmuramate: L-alanyl-gamma-D-glutamyl-meso-diaminopimelate ligase
MRQGAHATALPGAFAAADQVHVLARPELRWDAAQALAALSGKLTIATSSDALLAGLQAQARAGDHIVFMSNGGFDGVSRRLLTLLGA